MSMKPREWTLKSSRFANGTWEGPRFADESATIRVVEKSAIEELERKLLRAEETAKYKLHLCEQKQAAYYELSEMLKRERDKYKAALEDMISLWETDPACDGNQLALAVREALK